MKKLFVFGLLCTLLYACSKENETPEVETPSAIETTFKGKIDIKNLLNYAQQSIPSYISKDNTTTNPITDKGATLGRVLFYDKQLSANNTVSCATCHIQKFAFSDTLVASVGVNGTTGRHSMRLINSRFANETRFFWNERANTLEAQTTMPIQDHNEMGYSGQNGDLSIQDMITKISALDYYKELFTFVYGSTEITEQKIQNALAQFIRSIQSFDSKYDAGRSQVANDNVQFPNFTTQENMGKNIFQTLPVFDDSSNRISGGFGCAQCHRAPEFDIDPNSGNNAFIGSLAGVQDKNNTRAATLRDLIRQDGVLNGPMMHTGIIKDLQTAIGHYGTIVFNPQNAELDPRLRPNNLGQKLHLTATEVNAVIAFLKTLSGNNVYTDVRWSNPFPE